MLPSTADETSALPGLPLPLATPDGRL